MKLLMIFNPNAADGRAARLLPLVLDGLRQFADVDVLQTGGVGEATKLVEETDVSNYQGILAAGGDGTLFEVLNGLYKHPQERRIPLGLIPVGTGNAFARDLGLMPGEWRKGIEIIRQGNTRAVDVGRVEAAGDSFYFLNIIGAGLPADAMETASKLKFLGKSSYTLASLWHALKLRSHSFELEIDGEKIDRESMFIEVSNTRYTGTSFLMAPTAELDDGLLDVTLVGRLSRTRLLRLFPTIYRGEHVNYPEVFTCKAKTIRLLSPGGMLLVPDGELRGRTPVLISCRHRDLRIFA